MTATWFAIIVTAIGCYALKFTGLSVPERVLNHRLTMRAADLIPVALLGALIAVQVFNREGAIAIDARLLGLGVAAVLLILRVPFLGVVVGAALAAALVRMV